MRKRKERSRGGWHEKENRHNIDEIFCAAVEFPCFECILTKITVINLLNEKKQQLKTGFKI